MFASSSNWTTLIVIFMGIKLANFISIHERDFLPSYWQWYCQHQHADRFLYEGNLSDDGCQVECIFFDSSSPSYQKFYDTPLVVNYSLEDGRPCMKDHVCQSGKCSPTDDLSKYHEEKGFVVIRNISAKVPDKDLVTLTDTFIKIYVRDIRARTKDIFIGQTKVIENNNSPIFPEKFVSETIHKSSVIILVLYDSDGLNSDDYITTVYLPIKSSQRRIKKLFPGGWVSPEIIWVPEEPN